MVNIYFYSCQFNKPLLANKVVSCQNHANLFSPVTKTFPCSFVSEMFVEGKSCYYLKYKATSLGIKSITVEAGVSHYLLLYLHT